MTKGKRVKTIHDWGFGYKIHFSLTMTKSDDSVNKFVNLFSILQSGSTADDGTYGDILPTVSLNPKSKALKIEAKINGITDLYKHEETLTVDKKIVVTIDYEYDLNKNNGKFVTKIDSDESKKEVTNAKPKVYEMADVYFSSPFTDSASPYVSLTDLNIVSTTPTSKYRNMCVFCFQS